MPRTFAPGHRPEQPLYPDDLVYTTVSKVADYLQLPLPDPITMAADSDIPASDIRFPITGADYRRWGFAIGDVITVYDDNIALGNQYTLTDIQSKGSGGQIYLIATAIGAEAYTTANNAKIQQMSKHSSQIINNCANMVPLQFQNYVKFISK